MSPRSIRRAAEHTARKLAAKQSRLESATADFSPAPKSTQDEPALLSQAKIQSGPTGPRTPEGKAISSMNALRTGLTGRTVLLPSDDAGAYSTLIEQYRAEFQPVGVRETELVQSLADTSWRLRRIPGLEMAIYAKGRFEFASLFDEYDASLRPAMIELQTHLTYEKVLRNLQLQESRLRRRYTNELKELRELQTQRTEAQPTRGQTELTSDHSTSPTRRSDPKASPNQFEFSTIPTADRSFEVEAASGECAQAVSASALQNAA